MARVAVTLIKSPIGRLPKHRRTVEGLGLRRIRHTVEHELTPQIAGMIRTVHYLVEVKELTK